jgi:hypothetical protein
MMCSRQFVLAKRVAVGVLVAVAFGAVVSANHSWGNYHWARETNPVTLTLGQNFASDWTNEFNWALNGKAEAGDSGPGWNFSTVLELTGVAGGTTPRQCKAATGKIEVCAESYGNNGWLGLAQIWVSGDHITKAIAKMNDFYMGPNGFAPYNQTEWRQLVMCQEIGHDFGLGHQDENFGNGNLGSCMDYTSDPDGTLNNQRDNRYPNLHDYSLLEDIYQHLDGGEGDGGGGGDCNPRSPKCSGATPAPPAFDMELPDIGQWGRLIRTSRDGGQSMFVQDFGNGHRVYTHVTWTLEVAETLRTRR